MRFTLPALDNILAGYSKDESGNIVRWTFIKKLNYFLNNICVRQLYNFMFHPNCQLRI